MRDSSGNAPRGAIPVAVIGAGAAGVAAAYTLRKAGYRVSLFDSAHVVGGKLRSRAREDGFLLDEGAFFFPTTHRRMLALAYDSGFGDRIEPGGGVIAVLREGTMHRIDTAHVARDFLATQLFSTRSKLALARIARPLWQARDCSFDRIPAMAAHDTDDAASWARRHLDPELAEYTVALLLRGMSGVDPANASYVEFPALLALLKGARLLACRGGMGAYAAHLATGCELALGTTVLDVAAASDGVRVSWRGTDGVEATGSFAGCVIATSPDTTTRIHPALDPWRRAYLGRAPDRNSFSVMLGLSRPPAMLASTYLLVPPSAHPFLSGICCDHHKAPGRVPEGKGLVSLMAVYDWCDAHRDDSDAQIIEAMCGALESIVPGITASIEFAELTRWKQRYNPVGHYRDLGRFRAECAQRDATIRLAGDYFGYADLESAICSGEQAAHALAGTLNGRH